MITIKKSDTLLDLAKSALSAHFTNRRSVPGLLLELKRGRRVDAARPARRDRRRGTHDERDEGRAENRLAAALRRDERPLPACFFLSIRSSRRDCERGL